MTATEAFREKIENFLSKTGVSPTTLGKEAVGDPNFVMDVRAGRAPSLRLVEKVDAYIASAEAVAQ